MRKEKIFNIIFIVIVFITLVVFSFMMSNRKSKVDYTKPLDVTILDVNPINIDDYLNIYSKDELSFIYIGKDNCGYCKEQNKVLKEILDEYKITINYININKMTSIDIEEKLLPTIKEHTTTMSTPTLLLVKNKEIVMFKKGYTSKDKLIGILKEKDFI